MAKKLGLMTFNEVVSKAKAERWTGTLTIESAPGKGTTVHVTVPADRAAAHL